MNKYTTPEIEVVTFLAPNVIVASSNDDGFSGGNIELPDHNWED